MTDILIWLTTHWQLALLIALGLMIAMGGAKRSRHSFNVWVSKKHLVRLKKIDNVPQQFGFLRAVNPFIFEEMVLTALKQQGFTIKRNTRYTGDGGIDGRVKINGQWVLIQAKRYKSHISQAHVNTFSELCLKHRTKGIFIHTGRTSKQTWRAKGAHVDMVSGNRLILLLAKLHYHPKFSQ